jgi:hypothetical protein
MHRLFINGAAAVWEEFSIGRSHDRMHLPCDGESEYEPGRADNEIAAMNVDLDSVGDEQTAPEEEGLSGEEDQSTSVRGVMPFHDLDLMLISDSVIVEEIHSLALEVPGCYGQVRSVTELQRSYSLCLRVIGSVFRLSKGAPSQI